MVITIKGDNSKKPVSLINFLMAMDVWGYNYYYWSINNDYCYNNSINTSYEYLTDTDIK